MDASASRERIAAFLERHGGALAAPGVAVALTDHERCLGVVTHGLANVDAREAVAPHHRFQIGSISKAFTALAVLQQVEGGRIELEAPVSRYLPWFAVGSAFAPITIHHLLSHTSGLVSGTDFTGDAASEVRSLRDTETGFAPGERFLYSNVGYKALGLVLEVVAGVPWWELVRERVMEPIGMGACDVVITNDARARLAVGYVSPFDDRPWLPRHGFAPATWFESATADGTICATAEELTALARLLLARGAGVVSDASFRAMTTPFASDPDSGDRFGYGVRWAPAGGGRRRLGHPGGMVGFTADLLVDPTSGTGVTVLMNSAFGVRREVLGYAFACLEAEAAGAPLPDVPAPADPFRIADAASLAGRYGSSAVTVVEDGGGLALEAEGRRGALVSTEEDGVFVADDPELERFPIRFERVRGAVTGAAWGPRWLPREGVAAPAEPEPPPAWASVVGRYVSWNPWTPGFRVFVRRGELWLAFTGGATDADGERPLTPLGDGSFRVGEAWSPDRVRFDETVDGRTLRAVFDAAPFHRTFAP